jgi:cytochrome P450
MERLCQSPTDPAFVQDPYPFYDRLRAAGPVVWWEDYGLPVTARADMVGALLRDRRFGREVPAQRRRPVADHIAPFQAIEDHSMLELEPPRHTRLRGLVLRAFTSRRIAALAPEIARLCHDLNDRFPGGTFDLLSAYATPVPVIVIARLLGVPEGRAADLLRWSNAMVAMYQARRTRADEDRAAQAAADFAAFLRAHVEERRRTPADDLITHLIAAEAEGDRLTTDELISTCILLLNAGHEATVHTIGNGVKALLSHGMGAEVLDPGRIDATVEEILRWDPPLHLFTRHCYEACTILGHRFAEGDEVGLLLAAANRDPAVFPDPARFDPARPVRANASFGAGLHFCVGAPLARLELQVALPILFRRNPGLRLADPPVFADLYHFHGLARLMVTR